MIIEQLKIYNLIFVDNISENFFYWKVNVNYIYYTVRGITEPKQTETRGITNKKFSKKIGELQVWERFQIVAVKWWSRFW